MALVLKDRVKETSIVTGTGNATLLGAAIGYQSFNTAIPTGSTVYYCIAAQGVSEWEVGVGTFTAPDTLSRDTVLESSAAGALVTFTAGTKDVFVTYPAEKAIFEQVNGETIINDGPITVIGANVTSIPSFTAELGKFVGNIDSFAQIFNVNQNDGANASADLVVYNNLSNGVTFFADAGINSENYSSADYPIFTPNSGYYFSYGDGGANTSTLFLGSGDGNVHIFAGGLESNNVVATFDANANTQFEGNVSLPGTFSANGVSNFGTFVYSGANVAAAANNTVLATKAYVDDVVSTGVHFHEPVVYATAAVLPNSPTYSNGTDGVGATLTAGANAALVIDGVTLTSPTDNGIRVLIKDQASGLQNGVYVVTEAGSGGAAWVLTRSSDADTYEIASSNGLSEGSTFYVEAGTANAGSTFTCNTQGVITFGTTAISFALVSSALTYTGGTNINVSGLTISLTGTVAAINGGTGSNTTTVGDLLYGTSSNTWSKLPLGTAYKSLVVNGSGTQVEWNAVALNQSGAVSGALPATNGGTGQSGYTTGDTLYSSATNTLAKLPGNTTTTKKFLSQTGNGTTAGVPAWEQPAASDITGLAPSATTDTSNASNITSGTLPTGRLTGQYTGITGVGTLSNGTWTANTISVSYGGTGATNALDARTNLGLVIGSNVQAYSVQLQSLADVASNGMLARSASNTITPRTITAGTNIAVTNGDGSAGNPTIGLTGTVAVGNGGTGANTLTANAVVIGNGTSAVQSVAPGTSGNILSSNGTNWTSIPLPAARASGGAIWVNDELVSSNVSIGTGQNGFMVGPMATANGVSVTIASGQRLVVI
jgi:hypothetical protein